MTTWRKELERARRYVGDESEMHPLAPDEESWDVEFDSGYGGTEGPEVLAWSVDYVYFPVCYDGAEWLGSAPRGPGEHGQAHVGGG